MTLLHKTLLTFLQKGHVLFENTITVFSFMFCSIISWIGAILFGVSGDGVLARFRFDTINPIVKIIRVQSPRAQTLLGEP